MSRRVTRIVATAVGAFFVFLIVVAVAFAASSSYTRTQEFVMDKGETVTFAGHTFTFEGLMFESDPVKSSLKARVRIDGDQVYEPARSKYCLLYTSDAADD